APFFSATRFFPCFLALGAELPDLAAVFLPVLPVALGAAGFGMAVFAVADAFLAGSGTFLESDPFFAKSAGFFGDSAPFADSDPFLTDSGAFPAASGPFFADSDAFAAEAPPRAG